MQYSRNMTLSSNLISNATTEPQVHSTQKSYTGPIEPSQRKGLLPQYNSGKLVELQEKFNRLEEHSIHKILE